MKRKFLAMTLVALSALSLNCNAFAATSNVSPQIKVISTVEGISEEAIKEGVTANLMDEDGNLIPMDVEVSVKELPATRAVNASGQLDKKYSIEVYASTSKVESNTEDVNSTKNNIKANGYLRMDWTDVTGPKNTMDKLSGNWSVSKGNLIGCKLQYGSSHNRVSNTKSVADSFSFAPKYTNRTLHAHYSATIEGTNKNGEKVKMIPVVCVEASIFD